MRIAVGGFQHETNTFAPTKADYAAFEQADSWPALQRGEALLSAFGGMNVPVAGFIDAASAGNTLLPLVWCSATPSAHVTEDAFERVMAMMIEDLRAAGPVDAVYLDLHGAMVTEHFDDGEGEILRRVRAVIGRDVPLVASLDLHANVTAQMVDEADALIGYRTYPHVDMAETGARAAEHLFRLVRSGQRQAKAMRRLDYLIPLTAQCTLIEPAAELYALVAETEGRMLGNGRVTSVSFTTGFPPVDIPECGPVVVAYGETEAAAEAAAQRIADAAREAESDFKEKLWSARDAVAHAIRHSAPGKGPVVLADTQDNPGAGGNGDTIGILSELIAQDARNACLAVLYDPESAARAAQAGEGARLTLSLGAKTDGAPGRFVVQIATESGATHTEDIGAIVQASGFTLYDMNKLPELGGGQSPNVVDQLGLEALAKAAATGDGVIRRPSDNQPVKSVVFVQCAGQRDPSGTHLAYCSGYCCNASIKQA
ncbi:MAG: M81 family metallopeptidase, partial [Parvibaculum sp.]